jgi:FkbM family methyltransferase
MKKLRKIARRQIHHSRSVLKQNSARRFLYLKLLNTLGIRRDVHLRLSDTPIIVRSATPDLRVALASLGKEFEPLAEDFPSEQKGLIIDAGGYIGTAAIALAKIYPNCTIATIEPSSENYRTLLKNIRGFDNIVPIQAALVADGGSESIDLMSRGNGEWGFTTIKKPMDHPVTFLERVKAVTVDDILSSLGFDRVFVLKMDIEGAERDLMADASSWLDRVDILLIELHERIVAGCADMFEASNGDRHIIRDSGGKLISICRHYRTASAG